MAHGSSPRRPLLVSPVPPGRRCLPSRIRSPPPRIPSLPALCSPHFWLLTWTSSLALLPLWLSPDSPSRVPWKGKWPAWIGGARGHPLTTIPFLRWESNSPFSSPVTTHATAHPPLRHSPRVFNQPWFPGFPPTHSWPCVRSRDSLALWALWSVPMTYLRCGSACPFALLRSYRPTSGSGPLMALRRDPVARGGLARPLRPSLARPPVACVSLL